MTTHHHPIPARHRHHVYARDPDIPADHRGDGRCTCGLPRRSIVHDLPDAAEASVEQARRIGEKGDE